MHMRLIFALIFILLAPSMVSAQSCSGRDLSAQMPAAARAALDAALAAQPYPEGLLWQAKRGDTTIWLFGTYHLYDAEALKFMGRIRPLIQLADTVFVEGTTEDMDRLKSETLRRPELMFNYDNPTLPDSLSEADWQVLSAEIKARGIPPFLAAKMAPWLVSVTLSLPVCAVKLMAEGKKGLDFQIMEYASAEGKPIKALERFDTILTIFADLSFDDQIKMVQSAIPSLANGEDAFATMRAQYLNGRVLEIWEFSRLLAYEHSTFSRAEVDEMMATTEISLMRDRNLDWLSRLLPEAEGKTVFLAAGALHLAGRHGLLTLLDQRGFELLRLDAGGKSGDE